jgi:uncharacterized membrane protein YebE (DUF533 family)
MDTTVLSLASLELNELEAFIQLMFLAAHADGSITDEERAAFRKQVFDGTAGQLDATLVETMLTSIGAEVLPADRDARLETIRRRLKDPRKRRSALFHAARVVLADGVLALAEVDFLERAAAALGEPVEAVREVIRDVREGR